VTASSPARFFNSPGRTAVEFAPLTPGRVGLYSCGPTVYHYAHLGNLRPYVFSDTLRRGGDRHAGRAALDHPGGRAGMSVAQCGPTGRRRQERSHVSTATSE
jgi:hypothetical protein